MHRMLPFGRGALLAVFAASVRQPFLDIKM
jgi:hypothetical protein